MVGEKPEENICQREILTQNQLRWDVYSKGTTFLPEFQSTQFLQCHLVQNDTKKTKKQTHDRNCVTGVSTKQLLWKTKSAVDAAAE